MSFWHIYALMTVLTGAYLIWGLHRPTVKSVVWSAGAGFFWWVFVPLILVQILIKDPPDLHKL